jgi:hypothetical protein
VSGYVSRFHNIAVIVLAAGQADVMGTFQFTAIGTFFVDRGPKPVVGAALIAARRGYFFLRDGHNFSLLNVEAYLTKMLARGKALTTSFQVYP